MLLCRQLLGRIIRVQLTPHNSNLLPTRLMASAKEVQTALRQLLPTLDINCTTERQIREKLAQQLGPVEEHKKLIKQEIDAFLTQTLQDDGSDQDGDGDFQAAPAAAAGSKRARAAAGGATLPAGRGSKAAKEPRISPPEQQQELPGIQLDTQGLKRASISVFKGIPRVDLRNFFRNKEGVLGPTKKGISFNSQDWAALQGLLPQLTAAVQAGTEGFSLDLPGPGNIKLQTSVYQGKLQAAIREFYEDNGELKPGQRGITLMTDQYDMLIDNLAKLNKQLAAAAGPGAAGRPAAAGARQSSAAAAAATAAKPSAGRAAAAAAAGGGGGDEGCQVDLGGRKRAAVSRYTGRPMVDLREMYEKDGQLAPGKKGIMLRPDEWGKVVAAAAEISDAHARRDTSYKLDLGNKRQVTISEFRGTYYVGVREYYQQNGELKPGQKGLNVNGEQWKRLLDGMEDLTAGLG